MEILLSLLIGIGLSAACGFRVFVPLLIFSLAAYSGHIQVSETFSWMASPVACVSFGIATLLEIFAYYFPWVDNLLDTISGPAAIIAGTLLTASSLGDISPFLKWSLAIIAGGGSAGIVKGAMTFARGASSIKTAGFANPLVSTFELLSSIFSSILALFVPWLVLIFLILMGTIIYIRRSKRAAIQTV